MAKLSDHDNWLEVSVPKRGDRVTIMSCEETYVLVSTKKCEWIVSDGQPIFQSDYVDHWDNDRPYYQKTMGQFKTKVFDKVKEVRGVRKIGYTLINKFRRYFKTYSLSSRNPYLKQIHVNELIADKLK